MYSYNERMDLHDVRNQLNSKAIKVKLLNELGNFETLNTTSISRTLNTDGFSISKGADASDMSRMNRTAKAKAALINFAVATIDYSKLQAIKSGIERKIFSYKAYKSITYDKPALFIAVIQRNRKDSSIVNLREVQIVDRDERQKIISKAKRIKKNNQLCIHYKTSCLSRFSRFNEAVYYENLYIMVTR